MPVPASTQEWTVDMLESLPDDGQRYEIIDGELLVTPSPAWEHQAALGALHVRLWTYLQAGTVARVFYSPSDVRWGPKRFVQPDLYVIPVAAAKLGFSFLIPDLLLAVEGLSPSTARTDWHRKRRLYQEANIPEYWIVDADARSVARWQPGDTRPEVLADELTWHPSGMPEPLTIDLAKLFADALDWTSSDRGA